MPVAGFQVESQQGLSENDIKDIVFMPDGLLACDVADRTDN